MRYLLFLLLAALGVIAAVAGERDDSPGLFFLGLLVVLGGIVLGVRTARRPR